MSHPEASPQPEHVRLGRMLEARGDELANAVVDRHYSRHPGLNGRFGASGRAKCHRDARYHISYLGESAIANRPKLFGDYIEWARVMLAARKVPASDLSENLDCLDEVLREHLPADEAACATATIQAARKSLFNSDATIPTYIPIDQPHGELANTYLGHLLMGSRQNASLAILDAVDQGVPVGEIYLHVFQRSQYEIGRLWQLNRVTVAQEHYCSAATQLIMSQLYSRIFNSERVGRTLVAASVGGDLHEIGVRMVSDFFEIEGWDTFYLGASTPTATLIETVRDRRPDVVAISATMPYHTSEVARLVAALRSAELGATPHILVGGRPFNMSDGLWRDVGADATAADAADAVVVAARLVARLH